MTNVRSVASHFLNERYATVDCPQLIPLIEPLFKGFKALLAEPREFKLLWQIHHPELSKRPDRGLVFPKGEEFDQKWTFMYSMNLLHDLSVGQAETKIIAAHRYLRSKELAKYQPWFKCMHMAQHHLYSLMCELVEEIDSQMPGYGLYQQMTVSEVADCHVLRLLEYLYNSSVEKNKDLADGHYDQGFMTAQGYESSPGLVLVKNEGEPKDKWEEVKYEYRPGKVMVMPGRKFKEATRGLLEPMWHYVEANQPLDRNALISFAHTEHESIEVR